MKYLFIFFPFFAFANNDSIPDHLPWDTIPGGDSALYGVRASTVDTCWEIKNGWMSLKPGCISTPSVSANGDIINFKTQEFYVSDRKPKVVESFTYLGAYYGLRENGWYKELDTIPKDTLTPVKPRIKVATTWGGGWKYCDEHLKEGEIGPWRDSSSVNVLIWDGCKPIQKKVDKFENYTYSGDSFFFKTTLQPIRENYSVQYAYKGRLIKFSYIIKEL